MHIYTFLNAVVSHFFHSCEAAVQVMHPRRWTRPSLEARPPRTRNLQSKSLPHIILKQESRAVARKPCDAADVLFGSKFADNIHYKFKSSQASKARPEDSQL